VVWATITDPDRSEAWFGGRLEIELLTGGEFISYHRGGVRVVDRVVRMEAPTLLEHTFWAEVNPGALVTWRLQPVEGGCALALTYSLTVDDVRSAAETVARGDDEATIVARSAAGWHRLLDMLEAVLDGRTAPWSDENQRALQERYAALLP
jgi:uncharacterized protein YndB with AHSA1/START domain